MADQKAQTEKAKASKQMVDVRDRTDDDLKTSLSTARDELFRLKLGRFTNQIENVMQIRNKRRDIARIMTVMSERKNGAAPTKAKE
jgi:large subunit ribosomal protein L29